MPIAAASLAQARTTRNAKTCQAMPRRAKKCKLANFLKWSQQFWPLGPKSAFGEVHRAELNDGMRVAVKIQCPAHKGPFLRFCFGFLVRRP